MMTNLDPKQYTRLSKTMSHALRHAPGQYNLTLDAQGWCRVDALLAALRPRRAAWRTLTQNDIEAMMAAGNKQRYEIVGEQIRAVYGHSVARKIEKTAAQPPDILYHGTADKVLAAIMREGLRPMKRQYVHLSADTATAIRVGKRRTPHPVILRVAAGRAWQDGIPFYREMNGIWLSEPIPAVYLSLP